MANVIAEIRLAPGEVGYYDDYSRIYLNAARPTAKIYAGMNTTQIRRSIRSGRLRIVSGSLDVPAAPKAARPAPVAKPEKPAEEKPVEEKPAEEIIVETVPELPAEPVETAPAEAPETETVVEEAEAEEAPKPKRRRKKAADAE